MSTSEIRDTEIQHEGGLCAMPSCLTWPFFDQKLVDENSQKLL